jgi:hypothetical protein
MPVSGADTAGRATVPSRRARVRRRPALGRNGVAGAGRGRRPAAVESRAAGLRRTTPPARPRARGGRPSQAGQPVDGQRDARSVARRRPSRRRPGPPSVARARDAHDPLGHDRSRASSSVPPREDECGVLAAEPERVRSRPGSRAGATFGVRSRPARLLVRDRRQVDRGRDAPLAEREDRHDGLDRAGRPERVPEHRLVRRDRDRGRGRRRSSGSPAAPPCRPPASRWHVRSRGRSSSGARPAFSRARRAARTAPIPPGAGRVMWDASAVAPYPTSSASGSGRRAPRHGRAPRGPRRRHPSPMTKPSRQLSNGREAPPGRRCGWTGPASRRTRRRAPRGPRPPRRRDHDVGVAAPDVSEASPRAWPPSHRRTPSRSWGRSSRS